MRKLVCAMAVLGSTLAFAQNPTAVPGTSTNRAFMTNVSAAARLGQAAQNVTPEQRAKLAEINQAYNATVTPLYARLSTARKDLESVVNQEKIDEAGIRAKTKEIGEIETEIALARAQRFAKFRAFLPADVARRFNQPIPVTRPFEGAFREGQAPAPVSPAK